MLELRVKIGKIYQKKESPTLYAKHMVSWERLPEYAIVSDAYLDTNPEYEFVVEWHNVASYNELIVRRFDEDIFLSYYELIGDEFKK